MVDDSDDVVSHKGKPQGGQDNGGYKSGNSQKTSDQWLVSCAEGCQLQQGQWHLQNVKNDLRCYQGSVYEGTVGTKSE